ncbi:MAG: cation diffusion facilitator family transporter [Candidatus Thermoplasmatota archaeon]|nr:cation diffusion facilitator family transporter [Candidatus Thermoplasmatota archaeon]
MRWIPEYGDATDISIRAKYGYLEGSLSIIGNIVLFLIKIVLGVLLNSIALIADSIHSLSDVATSAVVIFGFKFSKKPADEKHPFGHGRIEYIATLVIAIILMIAGIEFIREALIRFTDLKGFSQQQLALPIACIVLFSAIVKEIMARYSIILSKKIQSDVLTAEGWHHRSDALSSIGVALSIIGTSYGFYFLDPLFGLVVSAIIIYIGYRLVRSTVDALIGQKPDNYMIKQIEHIAQQTKDIRGIHDISIHDYGPYKVVTLHAEVDPDLSLEHAHTLADNLERKIKEKTNYATVIHLEPTYNLEKQVTKKEVITCLLQFKQEIQSFHKVQIINRGKQTNVKLHIIVNPQMSVETSHKLYTKIKECIQKTDNTCIVDIHFEPIKTKKTETKAI